MVYMLVGYKPGETMDEILHRFNRLVAAGCRPYPMVYERWRQPELRRFARWAIRRYYEVVPWEEFQRRTPPRRAHDDVDGSSMSKTQRTNVVALSLGGGVQSTVLALLLERGLLPGYPRPDLAVFADTQWEPRAVYDNIEWLTSQLSYPVIMATAGDLRQATHELRTHTGNTGFTDLPLFTDGGLMKRQCTRH